MVIMKHAACTSSREPIPHSIHSAVSIPGDHGAVSEYETLNLPYKPHSEFHPEETMDNEVVPLCRAPSPWKISSTIGILSDPMLCVTPDKPRDSGSVSTRPSFNPQGKTVRPSSPVIYKPDPSLALTPEPSSKTVSKTATERDTSSTAVLKSNIRGNKNHEDDRDNIKLTQKVRFDIDSSPESDLEKFYPETSVSKSPNKIYQPLLYSDSKEATDNQNMFDFGEESRTIKYRVCSNTNHIDKKKSAKLHNVKDISDQGKITGVDSHDIDFTNIPSSEYSDFDENVKPKTISYRTSADSGSTKEKIPTDTYQSDDKIPVVRKPKRKVVVTREFEERPEIEDYQFPFSDDDDIAADIDSDCEHVFARPEYNSTLKLVTELKVMKESHPDVITVLHKKLTESEEKRTLINEKAASKVNIPRDQLSGLVSVELPVEEICQVEKEISHKAKMVKQKVAYKPKPPKSDREPDLLEFFGPDLQRELPDFKLTGLTKPKTPLTTASHDSAFDLYRHNRVWEGLARK